MIDIDEDEEYQDAILWNPLTSSFDIIIDFEDDEVQYRWDSNRSGILRLSGFETSDDSLPKIEEKSQVYIKNNFDNGLFSESRLSIEEAQLEIHNIFNKAGKKNDCLDTGILQETRQKDCSNEGYDNCNDLCLGRSLKPLILKNHIVLGSHYLVQCIQLFKQEKNELAENYTQKIFDTVEYIAKSIWKTNRNDLIFNIPLTTYVPLKKSVDCIIRPFSEFMHEVLYKHFKVRSSCAVELPIDFKLHEVISDHQSNPEKYRFLVKLCKKVFSYGIDIIWIDFFVPSENYLEALRNGNLKEALEHLWDFYEKCAVFFYDFFTLIKHDYPDIKKTIAIKSPDWIIPSWLHPSIVSIFKPIVSVVLAKILSIHSRFERPNCFLFGFGEGVLAKALTGSPLIVPNVYELPELGASALAFADSVSTKFHRKTPEQSLNIFQGSNQYITYFNSVHEQEEGFLENQRSRDFLINPRLEKTPLHYIIKYPDVLKLANKLMSCVGSIPLFNILGDLVEKILDESRQNIIRISDEEKDVLLKCSEEF